MKNATTTPNRPPQSKTKESPRENWRTFFPKKQRLVIERIKFYSRNAKRTAFASYKTYEKDCSCSESTILRAIERAEALGILKRANGNKSYKCPRTGVVFFQKALIIFWIGDVPFTKGSLIFGENEGYFEGQNEGLIVKNKELSKERGRGALSLPLEDLKKKIQEELKEYTEAQISQFWQELLDCYQGKERFISVDLDTRIARFKHNHTVRKCSSCGIVNRDGGTWCNSCAQKNSQAFLPPSTLEREELINPKTQELLERLAKQIEARERKTG